MKPTLTLVMIVKNESKIIVRCLESIRDIIDYVVISDTGSTDNTVELIEQYLAQHQIGGKVYQNEWKNFGYNRSLSVTNAQEWLAGAGVDRSKNYLLTIDADMCLRITPTFDKKALNKHTAWMLRQSNPELSYYNTRMFRADLPFRCVSVTHEYWACDEKHTMDKFEGLYIDDVGDGGAKADKYTRDIRLLTQGIEDEPNNERYFFYLAQTYRDIGDFDNAIKWYKRRIEAGGWVEELFISHKCLGDIYQSIGSSHNAVMSWIDGYNACPERSETLFRVINYYRNKSNQQQAAAMFLRQALKVNYPDKYVLFIEHNIYHYKLLEELSIVAFYVQSIKHLGFMATQHLMLAPDIPQHVRQGAMQNNFFYLAPLTWSSHSVLRFPLVEESTQGVFKNSSASLFLRGNKGGFRGVVRAVDYSITDQFQYIIRDPNNVVRTKNFWVQMGPNNQDVKTCYEIECTAPTVRQSHIDGLEDLRVVSVDFETMYGLAVDWTRGPHNHPSVVITHFAMINNKWVINRVVPTQYRANEVQKNWVPFLERDKLCAIYSHQPLVILQLNPDTGEEKVLIEKRHPKWELSQIRGSAIPVRLPNNDWLVLVHECVQKDTRKYYHRFMRYSASWDLLGVSLPFFFKNLFVEFSLSIHVQGQPKEAPNWPVTIFYSTRDNSTEMIQVNFGSIPWIPDNIPETIKRLI